MSGKLQVFVSLLRREGKGGGSRFVLVIGREQVL